MTRTVALSEFMPYGAPELQSVARPYMVRALLVSCAISTLFFAALGLMRPFIGGAYLAPPPSVFVVERMPAPPPMDALAPPRPVLPAAPSHATAGVALPVPDDQAPVESTIANADELRTAMPGTGTGDTPIVVEQPAPVETLPGLNQYVYVEQMPAPVRSVSPEYPAIAKEAGVSGLVVAHLLVGRDGHVLDVRIDEQHSILMLNEEVVRAARQWVFTPALANNRPVAVWVAVPFNFRLQYGGGTPASHETQRPHGCSVRASA
jgi:TonB family protein